jgi:hypothetical protein
VYALFRRAIQYIVRHRKRDEGGSSLKRDSNG